MPFDHDAYLLRIGLDAAPGTDLAALTAVHRSHLGAIPFENLDVLMGRGIDVAPDAVFAKLVGDRRGGYCFETNALLCSALGSLGFRARLLLGRVVLGAGDVIPARTHAVVLVELERGRYVVDAGFGGSTPRAPLALRDGAEAEEGDLRWRLAQDAEFGWRMTGKRRGTWEDLYVFDLGQVYPADVAIGNHWTSTHPGSSFTQLPTLARHLPDGGAVTVIGNRLTLRAGGREDVRELADAREVLAAVRDELGIPPTASDAEADALWRPLAES